MPRIRTLSEDFRVEEIPLFPLSGNGHFLYLWIEKRDLNTADVLKALGRTLGVGPREIGYAGRKDRRAVTRQWFSIPAQREKALANFSLAGAQILTTERHDDRLRVGQLWGNRFRLVVREVSEKACRGVGDTLEQVQTRGFANRYGRQRFGRDGKNADRGADILHRGRLEGDRRQAWLMVSALQSAVFNRVIERRPVAVWELLPGDLVRVEGSGELIQVEEPAGFEERLTAFEISPTGPIFGHKMRRPSGAVAVLEAAALSEYGLPNVEHLRLPRGLRLYGDRRPLRVCPRGVQTRRSSDEQTLDLAFELPAGAYATVLLEELFPDGFEEGPEH